MMGGGGNGGGIKLVMAGDGNGGRGDRVNSDALKWNAFHVHTQTD